MALIHTILPENAGGTIKKGYDLFTQKGRSIPLPFQLFSASPGLFELMLKRNEYYSNHPNLSFSLLAHIRYFVSKKLNYKACEIHNKTLLIQQGSDEVLLEKIGTDPERSQLMENEQRMARFVLDAMDNPESITQNEIDNLRELGWQDSDMLDALAQGVGMIDHYMFIRVFKPNVS